MQTKTHIILSVSSDILSSLLIQQIKNINIKITKIKKIYSLYKKIENKNFKIIDYKNNEMPLCIDLYSDKILKIKKILKLNNIPYLNLHKPFDQAEFLNIKKKNF